MDDKGMVQQRDGRQRGMDHLGAKIILLLRGKEQNLHQPPASTPNESLRQASQDDEFLPSRGVRCQYSPSGEEAEKNSL